MSLVWYEKNVDLPNIFGTMKCVFRIESDRAD